MKRCFTTFEKHFVILFIALIKILKNDKSVLISKNNIF
jgi:hypothetical protein